MLILLQAIVQRNKHRSGKCYGITFCVDVDNVILNEERNMSKVDWTSLSWFGWDEIAPILIVEEPERVFKRAFLFYLLKYL